MKLLRLMLVIATAWLSLILISPTINASPHYTLTQTWQRCPAWYCETGWYASPAVADVDKDGQVEALWGGYTLMAVNGSNGTIKWNRPQGSSSRLWPGIVIADLDHNGTLEVVTASGNGILSVYTASGQPASGWPVDPTGTGNELRSLAVADIDNNGDLEIVVCSTRSDNQWFVYEHTGALRAGWPKMSGDGDTNGWAAGCFNENVGVADIDNDGRGEIIGPNDTHYAAAFNDDGSPVRANSIYGQVGGQNKPWARVGLHVDHAVDLIGYANCGTQHRPNMANSAPTIADVNGDGSKEIIIVGNVHNCGTDPYTDLYEAPFILNADRTRWKDAINDWTVVPLPAGAAPLSEDYNLIENNVPNPVVVDLDGDGRKEILYPSYDGRVHAYWLDKTEHGNWPFEVYNPAEGFYRFATEPIVADLENDGKAEVIFASWTQNGSNAPGKLYIVSWNGNLIQSVDLPRSTSDDRGGSLAAPSLANIDADLDMEIVVGTINKGLVAYDLGGSSGARILWGTGRGSLQRTGLAPAVIYHNGSLDNSYKVVNNARPQPGEALTYTIALTNPGPLLSNVRLTDTLPGNAYLVDGSLGASSGSWGLSSNVLTWTGAVSSSLKVTITYVMTTSSEITPLTVILNTALINDGLGNTHTRTAAAIVDGYPTYLPIMRK
ncbi:MAG TPA: FG-GAP-like repeat-containing protein [Anaerolineae bacterium]|nr:FG-GAP-like repeat-containing protein [Anaerolineae bacterium]